MLSSALFLFYLLFLTTILTCWSLKPFARISYDVRPIPKIYESSRGKSCTHKNLHRCFSSSNFDISLSENESIESSGAASLATVNMYYRSSWLSWWAQIILSVISGVILTFANTVRAGRNLESSIWVSGFAFSAISVFLSGLNSLWTWNITRLCRRIFSRKLEDNKAIDSLRRYSKVSVGISLLGMLITLIGAEQIVGTLASKILSAQANGLAINPAMLASIGSTTGFQPLDIFLVQANTNTIVAHYVPLLCYIILQMQLPRKLVAEKKKVD